MGLTTWAIFCQDLPTASAPVMAERAHTAHARSEWSWRSQPAAGLAPLLPAENGGCFLPVDIAAARLCSKPKPAPVPAPLWAALPTAPHRDRDGDRALVTSERQLSPVLTPLLVGVRDEVALGLGVVVVL